MPIFHFPVYATGMINKNGIFVYLILLCWLQGIEFLTTNGFLQDDAESVAQFLHKGEGLNKTAIGDYLGER